MSNMLRFAMAFFAGALLQSTPLAAQEMQVRLKDAGFATHNVHGSGVELVLDVRGVSVRDIPEHVFAEICANFGPKIIPQIISTNPSFEPEYIGVRLVSSGLLAQFKFIAFSPEGDTCGAPL